MTTPSAPVQVSPLVAHWLHHNRDYAVLVLDPHGIVQEWLGAAERILGHAPHEAVGRSVELVFTPEDRERRYHEYELKVAAEDAYSEDSRWHLRKDGTRIWVTGSVSPVRGADGAILGYVKVMRDMTDQRAKTERVEHEMVQLGEAREQTRVFLRKLGHEVRNPLAVLTNTAFILERLVTDERGRKAVKQLSNQLGILTNLADDLMDVNRLELGKVNLSKARIDFRELLEDVVEGMQQQAARKSIQLEALLPPTPLPVEADFSRMQQVCVNLIDNAIKYTPQGGSVWVKVSQEGNEVVCRIQDNGIGIFPPVLPKLFDLFTQAPQGQEMRGGGIGVGLALVRQLVELHGGTVQAKSPGIGKGAEFVFRLPSPEPDTMAGPSSAA
ncbi:PAS domain-containing sensor histidine kinase [Ramlibacter sp. USB13]|uniref:histidine kinase n=1 Tax=Ramlibacter cellulosilyticus TaxID=2764187 RepID=A0A923SDU4_9BURK|nr:PAS domain-containing sensor histidine kinase [Ramlibacter cellulosilyticus]MBC5782247.1 PAS domain-containing sensor histidine kinase [Ramlibacter cellulosilyticus]